MNLSQLFSKVVPKVFMVLHNFSQRLSQKFFMVLHNFSQKLSQKFFMVLHNFSQKLSQKFFMVLPNFSQKLLVCDSIRCTSSKFLFFLCLLLSFFKLLVILLHCLLTRYASSTSNLQLYNCSQ